MVLVRLPNFGEWQCLWTTAHFRVGVDAICCQFYPSQNRCGRRAWALPALFSDIAPKPNLVLTHCRGSINV